MLVFVDDSGDPGFRMDKGSSPVFVIAMVIFKDDLEAEKTSLAIKELRRKLKVSDQYEFKFNKTNRKFRHAFISVVRQFQFSIQAIVVRKNLLNSARLRGEKENFYNYCILQVLKKGTTIKHAKLRFDKRGEQIIRDQLRVYLSRELDNRNKHVFHDLKFADSRQNTLVQLADMIAGSLFSLYTKKDKYFFNLFQKMGRVGDVLEFP